ncbi:bifunctional oligoribonuclease/PAP phosphatase NrnA [Mycoplasmatota bacterium]|nr:bifunctional oligoribonuclease/PAP phosphatase NrnA [Mycoplasmatota bacterium]
MVQKQILDKIKEYKTIIIHHHVNPDPDCIGSQLGLKYILEASFEDKNIYAVGKNTERTKFMGSMDTISDDLYKDALVIIVDVGDKRRIDDERFIQGKEVIKIDHHPLSEEFCVIEWVDTTYAAATEMIIDLYINNKEKLVMTEDAAKVLYAGMLTDTGRFYYNSVSERTLRYGAEVYQFGFDKQDLYANLYYKSIEELKFTGYLMANFQVTENGLGYMKITQEILDEFKVPTDFASGMVNTLANIKEIIMWMFFTDDKELGKIRTSFRSRGPIVNKLAAKYGGGGHIWASGTLADSWETVDQIIQEADLLCIEFKKQ